MRVRRTNVFKKWIDKLSDSRARYRINIRIKRLEEGNPGDVKPVGEGVSEMRIDTVKGIGCITRTPETRSSCYFAAAISLPKMKISQGRKK